MKNSNDSTNFKEPNAEYLKNSPNWQLVRDLVSGELSLKQHDLATIRTSSTTSNAQQLTSRINNFRLNEQYLPQPDAANCEALNDVRYFQYIQRASLFNATKRTEQGMAGMVFSKPLTIDLPDSIDYLKSDADGSEVGLQQQAQEVLNDILETARDGLFVDFPERPKATTKQEAKDLGIRANIVVYKAESILDWDSIKINAAMKLSFIKLLEIHVERDPIDIFKTVDVAKIRVLMLDAEGNYVQRLYDDDGNHTETTPKDKNNKPFKYIPFFFIGSVNNRPNVDPIPLIEIAEVNIAHYRNSADFEESAFIVGQPMPVITGLTKAWADDYFEDGIPYGSRAGLLLPVGGAANILQAAPNTMPESGMDRKEKQMVELGARLITNGGGAETAEAARIRHGSDASVLAVIVGNITQAYNDAIIAVLQFMTGTEEEFLFKLNEDFFSGKLTGEELTALVGGWQANAYSKAVLDSNLVSGGVIDEDVDLEEMNEAILNTPNSIDFGE